MTVEVRVEVDEGRKCGWDGVGTKVLYGGALLAGARWGVVLSGARWGVVVGVGCWGGRRGRGGGAGRMKGCWGGVL